MFMKALAILLAVLVWSGVLKSSESFGAAATGATQAVSGGGVTTKVTYLNPKSSNDLRFQVVLDTHSVALDGYDLKAMSLLRDDTGTTYLPNAVENKGGGHHREVILTFPKVSPGAKRLEIVLKDVAGVKERTFRWNLE
jgi:hypothetical protein